MNIRKFWLSTLGIAGILFGILYLMQNCGRMNVSHLDHRDGDPSQYANDLTGNGATIVRPLPVPAGTFSFIGTADFKFTTEANGDRHLRTSETFGKNYFGLNMDSSYFRDIVKKPISNSNTYIKIDYEYVPALVVISGATSIVDADGHAVTIDAVLNKRINITSTNVQTPDAIKTIQDPIFIITANQVRILPDSAKGTCLWNTTNFTSVKSGCKDLQTGIVWNTEPMEYYYNQTCSALNNAQAGGFTNWDLPSADELRQIAGLNVALPHFNIWRGTQLPGGQETLLTPGLGTASNDAKFPSSLQQFYPVDFLNAVKLGSQFFDTPYWTRDDKLMDLMSGKTGAHVTKSCGPLKCDPRTSDRAPALCISRPGGVLPPPAIGPAPHASAATPAFPTTGTYDANKYTLVPPLYSFDTQLPTSKDYTLAHMATEFAGQDVVVTGQVVFKGDQPKLLGAIQRATFLDSARRTPGPLTTFMAWSLPDASKMRVIQDGDVTLDIANDLSRIFTLTGKPIADLHELDGKKVKVKTHIALSDYSDNGGTLRATRIDQVPVSAGGCSFEADVFKTVPEGCQVDGGRIYWTGVGLNYSNRVDGTQPYFYPDFRFEGQLTEGGPPVENTQSLCGSVSAGPATGCNGSNITYDINLLLKQLGPGFEIPSMHEWFSYLNAFKRTADHLFHIPLDIRDDKTYRPTAGSEYRDVYLRTPAALLAPDGRGSVLAVKPSMNPKILPGSWKTVLGNFFTSDIAAWGAAMTQGVSLRLYETSAVKNAAVQTYFYEKMDYLTTVDPAFRSIGLVARYHGPRNGATDIDSNMYLARVDYDGAFTASIWRNVDGVWTKLAASPVPYLPQIYSFGLNLAGTRQASDPAGLLTFTTVGNQLTLKFTDQNTFTQKVLVTTTDNSIPDAGLTGVRMDIAEEPIIPKGFANLYRTIAYGAFSVTSQD